MVSGESRRGWANRWEAVRLMRLSESGEMFGWLGGWWMSRMISWSGSLL